MFINFIDSNVFRELLEELGYEIEDQYEDDNEEYD
jgi:hypothetical protein